ncbi:gremlin-2 [Silurus meridionalis]|uniref:CTCK domain-containing protein n=1 Tax=Silurus meridionalis TaxID=175797 RepID=A0A8T0BCE6_SILME
MFWKLAFTAILACSLCASMETKKARPRGSIPSPYKLKGNELLSSSSITLSSLKQPSTKRHKSKQEVLLSSREALVVTERKYLKSDWCKTQPLKQTVSLEGCVSQTIINHFCYGQCNSFYIPRHLAITNGRGHGRKRPPRSNHGASFQSCAFCKPHRISTLTVRLHCPKLHPPYRHRKVQRIKECRCMSVSVSETH